MDLSVLPARTCWPVSGLTSYNTCFQVWELLVTHHFCELLEQVCVRDKHDPVVLSTLDPKNIFQITLEKVLDGLVRQVCRSTVTQVVGYSLWLLKMISKRQYQRQQFHRQLIPSLWLRRP